jgi:predicted PurR-regulated permease PerM
MKYKIYVIPILTVLAVAGFVYLFSNVVVYMLISVVLSLLGQPIVKLYSKIKYKKFHLPDSVISLLTIFTLIGTFSLMLYIFIPTISKEISFLSTLNFVDVFSDIINQFPQIKDILSNYGSEKEISESIVVQVNKLFNFKNIGSLVNSVISIAGSFLGGTLAVLFITFFLLKEKNMLYRTLILITPSNYEQEMKDILRTTQTMLSKYFVGLFIDILIVIVVVSSLMLIFGIKNALLIGVFTGLMNVIPYLGPFISFTFAALLGITGCIEQNQLTEIGPVITKIAIILACVNLADGFLLQPYIFSNTVKAHPLEIFLVILMAATVAGIWGMVVAIPTYTLLRIVAKEFLVNFKFFKKLTDTIPE